MKIKKVLISQPEPSTQSSPYYKIAEKYGLKLDFRQLIKVEGLDSKEFRQQKVNIAEHSAIVFTSRTAIDHYFRLCKELRVPIDEKNKYYCLTETIALYLQKYIQYRKRKVFYSETGKVDDFISVIKKHESEKFLIVQPEDYRKDIIDSFEENHLKFDLAIMYRTVSNDFEPGEDFNYDMILFFSPFGVETFMKNLPGFVQGEISIGTLGAKTAETCKNLGLRVDIEVPSPQYTSIVEAVDDYIKENHKRK